MLMTQSKREPRAWTTNCTTKTRPGSDRILQEHRGPVLYSRMISVFPVRDAYVSIAELIAEVTSYLVTDGEKKKSAVRVREIISMSRFYTRMHAHMDS